MTLPAAWEMTQSLSFKRAGHLDQTCADGHRPTKDRASQAPQTLAEARRPQGYLLNPAPSIPLPSSIKGVWNQLWAKTHLKDNSPPFPSRLAWWLKVCLSVSCVLDGSGGGGACCPVTPGDPGESTDDWAGFRTSDSGTIILTQENYCQD